MSGLTRREFAHAALVSAAAGLLPACDPATTGPAPESPPEYIPGQPLPWVNWGGNQSCRPRERAAPGSEDELRTLLARSDAGIVRPVGTGHSFSPLVPSDGTLVASDLLHGLISSDAKTLEAEVWAGTRLHHLGPLLAQKGQAQPNLPDIDYQTLGGAVATSSHGTGREFGSLSHYVSELTLATPQGDLLTCDSRRNPEIFHAARCSLGALGVVTRMRIRNRKQIRLVERARFEPLEDVLETIEERRDRLRHFEFYAFPHSTLSLVLAVDEATDPDEVSSEVEDDPDSIRALRDAYRWVGRWPVIGSFAYDQVLRAVAAGTESVRIGPSHRVLPHVRLLRFREMEYTVPAEVGPDCLREILATIRERRIPVVFPIEFRYVKRDDVWLSQFYQRDGVSISIHQFADEDYRPYFNEIEPIFWKYEGRPHWGKLHTLDAGRLEKLYPRWRDFQEVRRELDPERKLVNRHLRDVFGTPT
ncbi:MAG: FAD-binding protein [bacterium]|nr:FAD-binding protein [bacterium]